MVKNNSKMLYLTDTFEDENLIYDSLKRKSKKNKKKIDKEIDDPDSPMIEFIIEEDENKEKQIRLNFEFKLNETDEIIKLDLEISKNTYLELADELLK
tara:strand:+ start:187 stop:480 length:294 start_codon:yes stop_codon:yes gene_type:complete